MDPRADRDAAKDAIFRYALGIDTNDAAMLASSFTEDARLDASEFANVGLTSLDVSGRDSVVALIANLVGTALDTSHSMTNFRINLDGDTALLGCYTEAQHFRKGEGRPPQEQEYYCVKSRYEVHLVREDTWRIRTLIIKPFWSLGNPDVILEQAKKLKPDA